MNNPKMSDELREIRDNARRDFLVVTCEKELVRQPTEHELEIMGKIPWNKAFEVCFEAMSKTHVPREKVDVLIKALEEVINAKERGCVDHKGCECWHQIPRQALKEFNEREITVKAYLAFVEPIKKERCKHQPEITIANANTPSYFLPKCKYCGVALKATWDEVK